MTFKERVKGWFKKKEDEACCPHHFVDLSDLEDELDDDDELDILDEDFDDYDASTFPPSMVYVDKEAIEGKNETNLEDLVAEFEREFAPKKAIWRGNETKAFIKWKKDNNL